MELTEEQKIMLQRIWNVLKDKFIMFIGETRSKDISAITVISNIGSETFNLFYYNTTEEATIAKEFIEFAVNTIVVTKSFAQTIDGVEKKYGF
ncbi:hypothetical protein I6U48_26520 [Clostridium sp. PL3]|uniref:Uncharacterized protein n=1 Tax=Clostridium thailandense TaxID=2794346 RepID=A0A949X4G2_9CLOT|nr:hypothetical protein [Clostridium thailandense]MBV7276439.1 hypothetical protein [Clostridium thailandense]